MIPILLSLISFSLGENTIENHEKTNLNQVTKIQPFLVSTSKHTNISNHDITVNLQLKTNATTSKNISDTGNLTDSSVCDCNGTYLNEKDSLLEKATSMKNSMKNHTTLISKIRHRATHSHEAIWASLTLTGLMMLLSIGVLHTKMWRDRPFIAYMDSQPVKLEQYSRKAEVKVKDLLRARGRSLVRRWRDGRTREGRLADGKEDEGNDTVQQLKMENFMSGDAVDSSHKALLESSEYDTDTDSEAEHKSFVINTTTGDWEGEDAGMALLPSKSKVNKKKGVAKHEEEDDKERKISTASISSDGSYYSQAPSRITRDLIRLSDSEGEREKEEYMMVQVG